MSREVLLLFLECVRGALTVAEVNPVKAYIRINVAYINAAFAETFRSPIWPGHPQHLRQYLYCRLLHLGPKMLCRYL